MTDEQNQQDPQLTAQEAQETSGEPALSGGGPLFPSSLTTTTPVNVSDVSNSAHSMALLQIPTSNQGSVDSGSSGVNEPGEDAASLVGSQSASGTSLSASPASLVAATPAEGASDVKSAIARLRDHLWTFEHSAVRHLHAELDKIEAWFK